MPKKRWQVVRYLLVAIASLLAIVGLFSFLHFYDNKYTYPVPSAAQGVLHLPDNLAPDMLVPLVGDWEFFVGELLTPQDFANSGAAVPAFVSIGMFASPALSNAQHKPYSGGSYRLRIDYGDEPIILRIDFPEIFGATALWVNGKLVARSGNTHAGGILPYTQHTLETFVLDGECEIVIQTNGYPHFYSGSFSPPMLGMPKAIDNMLFRQLIFYSMLFFSSSTLALFSIAVWLRMIHDQLYRYFGIMTLCFAISISYPFLRWLGNSVASIYVVTSLSSLAVTLCVLGINQAALGVSSKNLFFRIMVVLNALLCAATALLLLILPLSLEFSNIFTFLVSCYKFAVCVFLVYAMVNGLRSHPLMIWMIIGNVVYATGLVLSVTSLDHFGPIWGGWPTEYSGFAMVIFFAVMMIRYNQSALHENDRLNLRLEDEVAKRTSKIAHVLQERKLLLSGLAHDLKAPISTMQTYLELIRSENVDADNELGGYLKVIEQKSADVQRRLEALQLFTAHNDGQFSEMDHLELRSFLKELYQNNLPDAEASGIYFKLCLPEEDAYIMAWREKLTSAIENIIYNAISFMPDGGILMVAMFYRDNWVDITISDTGIGISPEHLSHVFDEHFSTRDNGEQDHLSFKRGLGLFFARSTVRELYGDITAYSDWGNGAEFNIQLPLVE